MRSGLFGSAYASPSKSPLKGSAGKLSGFLQKRNKKHSLLVRRRSGQGALLWTSNPGTRLLPA